ncbi:hypothetical protein FNF27_01485 [Cafeteria roenbergensis]|uniref:SANT domain-containing protein n=2 Tax=Cafeteria roenbergensis TaxID=33653 RepID=A0A5A8EGX9_CAFRO|nr:hypothetical protein FNF27_01485 [Cafeteria roenbergensis]
MTTTRTWTRTRTRTRTRTEDGDRAIHEADEEDEDDDDDDAMSTSEDLDETAGFVAEAVRRRQLSHQQAVADAAISSAALPVKLRAMRGWHTARPDAAKAASALALAQAREQEEERSLARRAFDAEAGEESDSDQGEGGPIAEDLLAALQQMGVDAPGPELDAVGVLMRGHPAPAAVEAALQRGEGGSERPSTGKRAGKPEKLPSRRDVAKAAEVVKRLAGEADAHRATLASRVAAAEAELEVLTARFDAAARAKADLEGRRRQHASRLAVHCRIRGVGDIEQTRLERRLTRRPVAAAATTDAASGAGAEDAAAATPASSTDDDRPIDRLPAPSQVLGWDASAWSAGNDGAAGLASVLDLAAEGQARGATARLALLALRAADDGSEAAALARLCRCADLTSVRVGRAGDLSALPSAAEVETVCGVAKSVAKAMADAQSAATPTAVRLSARMASPGATEASPTDSPAGTGPGARAVAIDLRGGRALLRDQPIWRWQVRVQLTASELASAEAHLAQQQRPAAGSEDSPAAAVGRWQSSPVVARLVAEAVGRQALERASALRAASAAWDASFADGVAEAAEDNAKGVLPFPDGSSSGDASHSITPRLPSIDAEARLWLQSHRLATLAARIDGAVALRFGAEAIALDIASGEEAAEDVSFAEAVLDADCLASPFSPGTGPDELARAHLVKEEGEAGAGAGGSSRPAKRQKRSSSGVQDLADSQQQDPSKQRADADALATILRSQLRALLERLPLGWAAYAGADVVISQEPIILVRQDGTTHPNFPVTIFQLPEGMRISVPALQPLVEAGIAVAIEAAEPCPICAELDASSVEGAAGIQATMAAATAAQAVAIRRKLAEMGMPEEEPQAPLPLPSPLERPAVAEPTAADEAAVPLAEGSGQDCGPRSPLSPAPVSLLARDGRGRRLAADSDPDTDLAAALADVRSIVPQALRVAAAKDKAERAEKAASGAAPIPLLRPRPSKGGFFPRDRPVSMPGQWAARESARSVDGVSASLARQAACATAGLRVPELTDCLRAATSLEAAPPHGDQPLDEVMEESGGPLWTASELLIFLDRFVQFPKDFNRIAAFLRRRRAPDCVGLYYAIKHRAQLKNALRRYRAHIRKRESLSSLRLAAECAARLGVPFPSAWLLGEAADVTLSVSDALPVRFAVAVGPYERLRRSLVARAPPATEHGEPLEQREGDEAALVRFALAPPLHAGGQLREHHAAWVSVYGSQQRQLGGSPR